MRSLQSVSSYPVASAVFLVLIFPSLAPKYDELASLYTSDPDLDKKVTIAKVDATANDVPDEIQGFPTIKLFPAGAKDAPITYSGSRTIEDLAAFIKENGKFKADAKAGGDNETESKENVVPDAEDMGKVAEAATESAKSAASEASEVVKTAVKDSDDGTSEDHDEL